MRKQTVTRPSVATPHIVRSTSHIVRIETDPNRQRVRAVCDQHGWASEWCSAGPAHEYDPEYGWTPTEQVVNRAANAGAVHLAGGARRVS